MNKLPNSMSGGIGLITLLGIFGKALLQSTKLERGLHSQPSQGGSGFFHLSQSSLSLDAFFGFSPIADLVVAAAVFVAAVAVGMANNRMTGLLMLALAALSICSAASIFRPVSDSHRSAALELFSPADGSFASLEEAYEALRTFEILGVEKKGDVSAATCPSVTSVLGSSSAPKELFYALKVNSILKCNVDDTSFEVVASRLKAVVSDASSLLDFYYSIGGLLLIKDQTSGVEVLLGDAEGTFQSIKALSQSDGRWRYSSSNPESSTYAAGLALEALAGVISLASPEINPSMIRTVKNDIVKLFDSIEKYDDGTFYFDEKVVDAREHRGPLSVTSSVIQGLTAFASVTSESITLPEDRILGLAKFFLGIGIPGDAKDLFNQISSLACLENNRVSIPLILSLPSTVLSLTKKDLLKVKVNTVLGSNSPPLKVKLLRAFSSVSKDAPVIESQELKYDPGSTFHSLVLPETIDVGSYIFVFELALQDSEDVNTYATGGQTQIPIYITGVMKIENAAVAVLDSDLGTVDTQKSLNLDQENDVSLSANHLQKLRLSFRLSTPRGHTYKPHQAFLKLKHETKVEHIFVLKISGKQFELVLDFLGLVEKFFYLSGRYDLQLTVGDAVMENSFLLPIGHVELDLPEAPEKAPHPPLQPADLSSRYGPKAEIAHVFRIPDKRPPKELSLSFLGLSLLPLLGFLVGVTMPLGGEFEEFPFFCFTCYICHAIPRWHCGSSVAVRAFLVEVGSVHNVEGPWFLGSIPDLCWTQNPLSPGLDIS
ncbi:hypothetical protein EUGRSUZ_K03255 [Eucalyptus grandis]|uniref:Uncharacterized protein n=2 Tax=Eucalyptus grandis TaxID=71139 RepID=A0ACC3J005_EUCGR|nr:hypothetical protein EUGRSUZ_K03255 [Eucalyptus grandis]